MTPEQLAAIERLRELKNSDEHWDDDKVQAAFDQALPLIEALQQSLSEAQADARVFSGSYNALAEDFGRLKEENERLRAGIGRAHHALMDSINTHKQGLADHYAEVISSALKELEALHDA